MAFPRFEKLNRKFAHDMKSWKRSLHFWLRAVDIYVGYKAFQFRVMFVKNDEMRKIMWDSQHEYAAGKIYSLCYDLGGFFLKAAQLIGKPDLAPAAWVERLVTLCDRAPTTPIEVVHCLLEEELGRHFSAIFEKFDEVPLGSASIAQVHRARVRGSAIDIAVKVQHPGVQDIMMIDMHNLRALACFLQKTDIKFDLVSVTKEIEKQVSCEFNFLHEAEAMEKLHQFLYVCNHRKLPVLVPRVIHKLVTRKVLAMEFIDGIPIMNLGSEMSRRGIHPNGRTATASKLKILNRLSMAYGQMILKNGFFHADPHPGNILICKGLEVALLDYGQVKHLPDNLRLGYANLVLAIAEKDPNRVADSFMDLGIKTYKRSPDGHIEMLRLAESMFDTALPPGELVLSPYADNSSIKKIAVETFPEELFSVLRTVQLLRGLSVGLGVNYSCAEHWRMLAEEALCASGRVKGVHKQSRWKEYALRKVLWK